MAKLPPKVRDVIIELEKELKGLYGERFRGLLLYGSYARGTAWEGSDVDLLLLLQGPVNSVQEILRTNELTAALSLESELVLSVLPFNVEDFEEGKTMFLRNIREDAIAVAA